MKSENSFDVESRYEHHFDTLAIRVTHPYKYKESVELEEGIILDFDEENIPVALEILNASKILRVPKYSLNDPMSNMGINMQVRVNETTIILKALFEISIHNNAQKYEVESFTSNNSQIPNLNAELATA
ncbi:MAG: DUF2283 domain-containing protein [Methanobrevibacter sp.]|nr:DUF2283 domain-containing protein [Methanobrevibacter sp.]